MADPISITLGVLPLIGGALKAYRSAHATIVLLRNSAKEIERLIGRLELEELKFKSGCELLLHAVFQNGSMLDTYKDDAWNDLFLESKMKGRLQRHYSGCQTIVHDIKRALERLNVDLEYFKVIRQPYLSN